MNSSESSSVDVIETLPFRIVYGMILSVVFLFSTVFGFFVCYVIISNKMLKKRVWFYFFMVAFVDATMSFFATPIIIAASINENILTIPWLCKLNKTMLVFFGCWSLHTLAALSLYKCCVISRPLETKGRVSSNDIIMYLVISLTTSLFFAISPLFGFSNYRHYKGYKFCVLHSDNPTNDVIYSVLCGTFVYFLSLGIIVITSVKTYTMIKQQNIKRRKLSSHAANNDCVPKTVFMILISFLLLYTPLLLYLLLGMSHVKIPYWSAHIVYLLMFSQGCVNPMIYFVRHPTFLKTLRKRCRKKTQAKIQICDENSNRSRKDGMVRSCPDVFSSTQIRVSDMRLSTND